MQDHGLPGSLGELLQTFDDVEVACVGSLTLLGESKLTVPLLELLAAPAIGRKVPHHVPTPGLRVVVAGDAAPVLPHADQHFLSEILGILAIARKEERLSDQAMGVPVKEAFELITPLLIAHRTSNDASLPNKTPSNGVALHLGVN